MATATWNGVVIAEADDADIVIVENNRYFPRSAVKDEHLVPSDHTSVCPSKGSASYFSVMVGGQVNENAAWFYPSPKDAAAEIAGRVAFWKGVTVTA